MTNDGILVLQTIFTTIWRLFTSWYIPGTRVTPAMWALFILSAVIGLRFMLRMLQSDVNAAEVGKAYISMDRSTKK